MAKHFQKRGRRILGWDLQDWIKGFFGTNATLSIVILLLICFYLIREAVMFFPSHHQGLTLYRQTGQEFVGHLIEEVDEHAKIVAMTDQAYYRELDEKFGNERGVSDSYEALLEPLEDAGEDFIDALDDEEEGAQEAWDTFATKTLSKVYKKEIDTFNRLDDDSWNALLASMKGWDPLEGDPPAFVEEARAKMKEGMASFELARAEVSAADDQLDSLRGKLVKIASEVREDAKAELTSAARKIALEQGIASTTDPDKKAELEEKLSEVKIMDSFPFAARSTPMAESKDAHKAAAADLKAKLTAGVAKLPAEFASQPAAELIERVRKKTPDVLEELDESVAEAARWRWDKPVGYFDSALQFFFGRDWVTNSSWHDFYGLLPLFTGSVLISCIALAIAVPFSVGAAIYVNRIATRWEQNIIKPVIEMVQAIPSVVLGIFGILVLGEGLREFSQVEALSWIPGFPMQERLNILNAGLLLALMAVPTIFTLCEDALNNVPRSFSEASLALGASRIQTVIKVILPTAISGIFAAILLGLGRVIGETMVVLLVAGNKIAMPDWGAGVGVVAQPTHTMTGIIAQEMGEVADGTLHWRALFLVGLVLFTISLCINVAAQRIIRRLSHL